MTTEKLEALETKVEESRETWLSLQRKYGNPLEHNSPEEIEMVDVAFHNYNTLLNRYLDLVCETL